MADLTTQEAAERLGVSARQIRRLFEAGRLRGYTVAGRLLLNSADIQHRATQRPGRGRPLGDRVAWGLLWELSGESADWLLAYERSRLRRGLSGPHLRDLTAVDVALQVRDRATRYQYRVLPTYVGRLLEEDGTIAGGVSAADQAGADIVALGFSEMYASSVTHKSLVRKYALSESDDPNVILRVVSEQQDHNLRIARHAPAAAVAVDLIESLETRTRSAGLSLLESLLDRQR